MEIKKDITVYFEKLVVALIFKNISSSYRNRRFIVISHNTLPLYYISSQFNPIYTPHTLLLFTLRFNILLPSTLRYPSTVYLNVYITAEPPSDLDILIQCISTFILPLSPLPT
jgi:hypothetical protein